MCRFSTVLLLLPEPDKFAPVYIKIKSKLGANITDNKGIMVCYANLITAYCGILGTRIFNPTSVYQNNNKIHCMGGK